MNRYEDYIKNELRIWEREMLRNPSFPEKLAKRIQNKVNNIIPEKAHKVITESIKMMVKTVLFGSDLMGTKPVENAILKRRDAKADEQLKIYTNLATISGFGTGAGGLFIGLADFPIFLSLKMKFLHQLAGIYGYDVDDFKERVFILYIFQLTFSSRARRQEIFPIIKDWDNYARELPLNADSFDWRIFQQEYRDSIDLAKLLQIVPVIGAAVGAVANHQLMKLLGANAKNCYHNRLFNSGEKPLF